MSTLDYWPFIVMLVAAVAVAAAQIWAEISCYKILNKKDKGYKTNFDD